MIWTSPVLIVYLASSSASAFTPITKSSTKYVAAIDCPGLNLCIKTFDTLRQYSLSSSINFIWPFLFIAPLTVKSAHALMSVNAGTCFSKKVLSGPALPVKPSKEVERPAAFWTVNPEKGCLPQTDVT